MKLIARARQIRGCSHQLTHLSAIVLHGCVHRILHKLRRGPVREAMTEIHRCKHSASIQRPRQREATATHHHTPPRSMASGVNSCHTVGAPPKGFKRAARTLRVNIVLGTGCNVSVSFESHAKYCFLTPVKVVMSFISAPQHALHTRASSFTHTHAHTVITSVNIIWQVVTPLRLLWRPQRMCPPSPLDNTPPPRNRQRNRCPCTQSVLATS